MPLKLAQVNARLDGVKKATMDRVTELNKLFQKAAMFIGYSRVYKPYSQSGNNAETLPPENVMVQARFQEVIAQARKAWTTLVDSTFTQDTGNTRAKADVVINGIVIASDVPVTTIMFCLNRFTDVLTFVKNIPTPNQAVNWAYDSNQGLLKSVSPEIVQRTKKVMKTHVKFEPTDKHPGQSDTYTEDTPVGEYTKLDFSGACPVETKLKIVENASAIVEALKVARELANIATEVAESKIADKFFDYIFAPLTEQKSAA